MERIRVDPNRPEPDIVEHAANLLRRGAVVAYPTETFYGLGADAFDSGACERIRRLKGREADKPLPLIVDGVDRLESLCDPIPHALYALATRFWPGPLTLVVPVRTGLGGPLTGHPTVAVRVSGLVLARELVRKAGVPLTATSANRSGKPPATTADEVGTFWSEGVDVLLDSGPTSGVQPSTIVDLSGRTPRLLRQGPVGFDEVLKVLEQTRVQRPKPGKALS